jgi:L-2-hydroxyglutarate oxidase
MQKKVCDFLVVGGGVIGLTSARALASKYPDASIILIEKEAQVGLHTSGRNSGVLHAGFYYASDS